MIKITNDYFVKTFLIVLVMSIPRYVIGQEMRTGPKPQYLFNDFSQCKLKMKDNHTKTAVMNYNTVTGCMVFIRDDEYLDLLNPEMVDTIYLNDRLFIPVWNAFYEVLQSGPVSLFVQHKGEVVPPGKPAAYGGTSQTSSSDYLTTISMSGGQYNLPLPTDFKVRLTTLYWIRKDDHWFDFLNKNQFLKLFPEKKDSLKSFMKENRIKMNDPKHVKQLVDYYISIL